MLLRPRASEKIDMPINLRFGSPGERNKGVIVQSMDGARLAVTAFGGETTSSDTYQILPLVYLRKQYKSNCNSNSRCQSLSRSYNLGWDTARTDSEKG